MANRESEPVEFDCIDCGDHVYFFGSPHDNDQDICMRCLWLRTVDADEREELKKFLFRTELP